MEIPQELKEAIEEQTKGIKSNSIIENAQIISNRYRNNDGKGTRLLTKKDEAISYAISRMPSTYCAVSSALKQTLENYNEQIKTSLDIGAGTGAATWAIKELIDVEKSICLEREDAMINIGKKLMNNIKCDNIEWQQFDLTKENSNPKADLVITSYMINELPEEEKENVIKKLWNSAEKILLIIEPGTPAGFKNILKARDILLENGASIIAPCASNQQCPLKNDWCSFYVRVARSGIHRQAKMGELSYEDEKFSYMAFSKTPIKTYKQRILRHPQIGKGYIKVKLCTENGIEEKTYSKKDGEIYKKIRKMDAGETI